MLKQTQKFCSGCQQRTKFEKTTLGAGWHILLLLLTAGIWLLVAPFFWLFFGNSYRCNVCGGK